MSRPPRGVWLLALPLLLSAAEPAVAPSRSSTAKLVQQHLTSMLPLATALDAGPLSFDFLAGEPGMDEHVHLHWQHGHFRQEYDRQLPSAYGYDGTDFWYGSAETLPYRIDRGQPPDVADQYANLLYYALPAEGQYVRALTEHELLEADRVAELAGFDLLAYCPPAMSEVWLLVDPQTRLLAGTLLGDERAMDDSGVLQLTLFGGWQAYGGVHYPGAFRELTVVPDTGTVRERPVQTVSITAEGAPWPESYFGLAGAPAIPAPALPDGRLSLPFRLIDDDITLDLRAADGKPLVLKFDSGANIGLLRGDVAERLGLTAQGNHPISGHGGTAELALTRLEGVDLGGVAIPPYTAAVLPPPRLGGTDALGASLKDQGVHGLLGTILLNAFVVQVDFAARKLTLFDAANFDPQQLGGHPTALPLYRSGLPYTDVVVDTRLKGGAFFNTGARPYFNLQMWALDREGMEYPIEDFATGLSIHGPQLFGLVRPRQVELGSLRILSPRTFLEMLGPGDAPEPARMASFGSEFFHDYKVTFDLWREQVYVERYDGN